MSETSHDECTIRPTHIGGQALLEGIMMRGKYNWAVAVREPSGAIYTEEHDLVSAKDKHAWLKWPIIRGMWGFYETMVLAIKAFGISAEHAGETEEEQLTSKEIGFTMVLGLGLAVGLFIVLPAVVTNLFVGSIEHPFTWNVVDGVLRLVAFFLYIWAVSRLKEIHRVFAYHGAEHKTIHAYEHGVPLETERHPAVRHAARAVRHVVPADGDGRGDRGVLARARQGDPRALGRRALADGSCCSTSPSRILLLPLIAGIAYEITVKWAGTRPDNPLVKVLLWPGMQMQRLTTAPPDDSMVEIAVAAMNLVVAREDAEAAARGEAQRASGTDRSGRTSHHA